MGFWQTYRDQIIIGLIVGLPALIATILGVIYQYRQWRDERRRDEEEQARLQAKAKARSAFPFQRTTPAELPECLVNFVYKDIPHVPRCAPERQAELKALAEEKRVLLTGRSGLGKTNEAVHLVRRLAGERPPDRVIVLVPEGRLAEPRELPDNLPTRQNTVVLFLDNLHEGFREAYERPRGEARAGGPDPRTTLQAVLRWFEVRCDDFRVVATVREEPAPPGHGGWRDWLGYREDDPLWGKFCHHPLPWMERGQALAFIQAMQDCLATQGPPLAVDPDAVELMAWKFDGTPASLRDFLLIQRKTRKRERVTRAIVAQEFDGRFPNNWEREAYNPHIAPYPGPRHLFAALSLLQQAGVTPYRFLAFRLALQMWGHPPSEEERLMGPALAQVETWVKERDGVLECSEAHLKGRADLAEGAKELTEVLLAASRKRPFLLAPELIRLGNALWAFPRGDRAENLEEAIACYERALEVYTRADFPVEWAANQNNLGTAYSDRIRGDRAENLEEAIGCYERALEVYTRADFPVEWATTQNNLGTAYSDRIRGDRAENLEEAIACYERALEVRTRADFPVQWAMTQNNLGNAYSDRIRGDRAENLEEAIACYERALEVYTRADFPVEWAANQNNLGLALADRIREDRAENLEEAIACYERALEVRTRADFPVQWAMTQNNLGNAYSDRIRGDRAENLEEAIACYERALEVYTRADFPVEWAANQNNLGLALADRIRGDRAENVEEAIACYRRALEVYTQADLPVVWAMTQNNLGLALADRIWGDRAENVEEAIACYERALEVYTRADFPVVWAGTQNNLGLALADRIRGDRAENLEEAIACYERALEVRTRADFPVDWAGTQNNLGAAYWNRIRGDRAENLEEAIACYQRALEVRTRADFPVDWAMTQNNLGNAYVNRIRGDRAENLEEAIACYQGALEVYTRADFPADWAMTQNNLGNAYVDRIRGDRAENLEEAIACYERALEVYTRADFPVQWAMTQNNLGIAYSDRIRGDRAENLEEAIACYERALEVYTRADFPVEWARTQNNLGTAYGDRIRGDRAENLEEAIACYERALEVYTRADFPADWAMTQNNLGNALSALNRHEEALEPYTQAIEVAQDGKSKALYLRNRADTYIELGRLEEAEEDLERAKGLDAESAYLFARYGQLHLAQDQYDQAIEMCQTALDRDLKELWVSFNLALALLGRGEHEQAVAEYQRGIEMAEDVREIDDAIEDLEKMRARKPDLAGVDEVLQMLQEAKEELERAAGGKDAPE